MRLVEGMTEGEEVGDLQTTTGLCCEYALRSASMRPCVCASLRHLRVPCLPLSPLFSVLACALLFLPLTCYHVSIGEPHVDVLVNEPLSKSLQLFACCDRSLPHVSTNTTTTILDF